MIEDDVITRLVELHDHIEAPVTLTELDVRRGRRRVLRSRALLAGAVGTVAVVLGATAAMGGLGHAKSDGLEPAVRPGIVAAGVPVWYDAKGLHHGDVVEQTPVVLLQPERTLKSGQIVGEKGALALVRSGAVYLDPATGDVWFHPWGGTPRIVGQGSATGPGGDPNGDTAAWFEGSDLVIYDTAGGGQLSRTHELGAFDASGGGGEYTPTGNSFLQVSAERIRWKGEYGWYSHDVRAGTTSAVPNPKGRGLVDVHDDVKAFGGAGLLVSVPGQAERRFPTLSSHVRLSSSGNFVLAAESIAPDYVTDPNGFTRHGPAIVDTRTGELWRVPKDGYPWITWSYGEIALMAIPDGLLVCDAARRTCETLQPVGPFLMPTN
jgi:hypothetical protein